MASNDEAITKADLQELKVYIDGKFAEVDGRFAGVGDRLAKVEGRLVEIEGRLTNLEKRLDSSVGELKAEIGMNTVRIDGLRESMGVLKDSVGWNHTVIAIVITIVGLAIAFAPTLREMFKDRKESVSRDEVREMIRKHDEELMKLKGSLA